jgi:hypothetical protein
MTQQQLDRAIAHALNPLVGDTPARRCTRWMKIILHAGPMPASEAVAAARALGFGDAEVREAQRRLNVRLVRGAVRLDADGRPQPSGWLWSLQARAGAPPARRAAEAATK